MNQQLTDDLRVLLKTSEPLTTSNLTSFDGAVQYDLPDDYMHMLNCICGFDKSQTSSKCSSSNTGTDWIPASKLDTASWPHTIENYYMKPSRKRPYYYIINI